MADTHQGSSASDGSQRPFLAKCLKPRLPHPIWKYLVLTPIEKNHTNKDYIRLSMVFPVGFTLEESGQLSARLASQTRELFERTLSHWPFLNGHFGTKVIEGKSRLVLWYTQPVTQRDVIDRFTEDISWPKKAATECQDISTLPLKLFEFEENAGEHIEPEKIATYFGDSNYPVMIRVKLLQEGVFVIRFAFSERIFDMQFVQNFLRQFLDFTLPAISFKDVQPLDVRRTMPKIEKFYGVKQNLSPEEDEEASSRALRTQHDVVFENWIDCGYARGGYIRACFGGKDVYPYFMPCVDHMEEGKVILLPPWGKGRKTSNDVSQYDGWDVCVCLEKEELTELERVLLEKRAIG
ncbi:hypothetical protein NW768_003750 [Fusarium equiseti]|uniref:Uncharacterized protein n=1 Tax=Fusarium equiseti TaxID=61235 RepID=A0ABQ8RIS8_FUSEQ|nr:hypothetical protein NW768_003750 [Fusarium equiseti]